MISTVSSATSARSSGRRKKLRMLAKKSRTSCSAKALSSDSIGVLCVTFAKLAAGAMPTRSDGLSARFSAGKRASIAALRRRNSSYSASEISGAASRVIQPVVMRDLGGEPRQLGARLVLGQRLDRPRRHREVVHGHVVHGCAPAIRLAAAARASAVTVLPDSMRAISSCLRSGSSSSTRVTVARAAWVLAIRQ